MDTAAIFSRPDNILFLEPDHNPKQVHLPQINVMIPFSETRTMTTFVIILPRSISNVTDSVLFHGENMRQFLKLCFLDFLNLHVPCYCRQICFSDIVW